MKTLDDQTPEWEVEIGLAKDTRDLIGILQLQYENSANVVPESEKAKKGFVSLETSPKLLKEIAELQGITVARIRSEVVGYLMPMTVEQGKRVPLLDPFIAQFEGLVLDGKPLTEYNYCILGQVCIDPAFRGRGIIQKLYGELKPRLAREYDFGISEIGKNNPRSLHVHMEKIGLKIVGEYAADGKDWCMVSLDLRPFKTA